MLDLTVTKFMYNIPLWIILMMSFLGWKSNFMEFYLKWIKLNINTSEIQVLQSYPLLAFSANISSFLFPEPVLKHGIVSISLFRKKNTRFTSSRGRKASSWRATIRQTVSPCFVLLSIATSSSWVLPVMSRPFTYQAQKKRGCHIREYVLLSFSPHLSQVSFSVWEQR